MLTFLLKNTSLNCVSHIIHHLKRLDKSLIRLHYYWIINSLKDYIVNQNLLHCYTQLRK